MSRKLKVSEYEPLLNKVALTFGAWSSKSLSFAGRLQLIASVIMGKINFWISTFLLPKSCVKKLDTLCSRFLWAGSTEGKYMAKVAWHTVCLPKQEGGLGLRRITTWNTIMILRLIWLLFSDSQSLWVSWHMFHHLQNKCFWTIKANQSDSGTWKSLLTLRHLAEKFLFCVIGNGHNCFFWLDNWTSMGPLICAIGNAGPSLLRVPLMAKVADVCTSSGGALPPARSDQTLNLHIKLSEIESPMNRLEDDRFEWRIEEGKPAVFSARRTWDAIRTRAPDKEWFRAIWFKGSIPRQAFFMWTAQLNRLPIRQRIARWNVNIPTTCGLCGGYEESREHLFLSCSVSREIWASVLCKIGNSPFFFLSWTALLAWVKQRSPSDPSTLRKLVVHTTLYSLWKERNNRVFNAASTPSTIISRSIDWQVRNTITARRHRRAFRGLMQLWLN